MKYENFDKVKSLVQQISKHKQMLESLRGLHVCVVINQYEHSGKLMTVGVHESYEHEYQPAARMFIDQIIADLIVRIDTLTAELEAL